MLVAKFCCHKQRCARNIMLFAEILASITKFRKDLHIQLERVQQIVSRMTRVPILLQKPTGSQIEVFDELKKRNSNSDCS